MIRETEDDYEDERESGQRPLLRVDPLAPQDATVHLSLPLQDDLEDLLEECGRLRRLGHFADAIALFQNRLSHFFDNRYVLVQYAQCLFEGGQFAQLGKLAEEKAPRRLPQPDALQLNWDMLLLAAEKGPYKSQFDNHEALDMLPAIKDIITASLPKLDSTECQVLALLPRIGLRLETVVPLPLIAALYKSLADRGMVWEFKDVLESHLANAWPSGVLTSATASFPPPPPPHHLQQQVRLRHLRELWSTDSEEDEPTLFALLEMFTALALQSRRLVSSTARSWRDTMKDCMDAANQCGFALLALDDSHLMTRPCLRWLMAKQMINDDNELLFFDQMTAGGRNSVYFSRLAFPSDNLPRYDASHGALPQWTPRPVAPGNDFASTAEMVLRAADELGDLDLQTGCLKELMYRGVQPPEKVLAELRSIWSAAGNQKMLPWLNLFRALLAHTPAQREELKRDLLLEIETGNRNQIVDRFYLLAVLSLDPAQQKAYLNMARATDPVNYVVVPDDRERDIRDSQRVHPPLFGRSVEERRSRSSEVTMKARPDSTTRDTTPSSAEPIILTTRETREIPIRSPPPRKQPRLPPPALPTPPPLDPSLGDGTTATNPRDQLARIKAEIADIETQLRMAARETDPSVLRTLHHRLATLGVERYRLEMQRIWDRERGRGTEEPERERDRERPRQRQRQRHRLGQVTVAGGGAQGGGGAAAARDDNGGGGGGGGGGRGGLLSLEEEDGSGPGDEPLLRYLRRRTTVEDYPGGASDRGGDDGEVGKKTAKNASAADLDGTRKGPLLLEFPGYGMDHHGAKPLENGSSGARAPG
ncbi:506d5266-35dd-409b-b4ee-d2a11c6de632 [Thermothielavioides terrestris]|nr:506d5266-35dd-409b-b4ee-d2a11c6de632 [Thermothielavioides terrestris]